MHKDYRGKIMITDKDIREFVRQFNTAQKQVTPPNEITTKTGATFVFGAMNGYLHMMRTDKDYSTETYNIVKNAFQNVVEFFTMELDVENFETREQNKELEYIKFPEEQKND